MTVTNNEGFVSLETRSTKGRMPYGAASNVIANHVCYHSFLSIHTPPVITVEVSPSQALTAFPIGKAYALPKC